MLLHKEASTEFKEKNLTILIRQLNIHKPTLHGCAVYGAL